MNLIKKIMLMIVGLSIVSGNQCMHHKKSFYVIARTESGKQATEVVKYVDSGDRNIIWKIGEWLSKNREITPENNAWNAFINGFLQDVESLKAVCDSPLKQVQLEGVKDAIKKATVTLKPGENCTQLLADLTQEIPLKLASY